MSICNSSFKRFAQKNAKIIVLIICLLHNTVHTLLLRYTRTRNLSEMYIPSFAVFYTEVLKFLTCILLVLIEEGGIKK